MADSIIFKCHKCKAKNKVQIKKIPHHPKCGKCGEKLNITEKPVKATDTTFDELINSVDYPVIVDFWADWCAPCKAVSPIMSEISSENAQHLLVLKVNVDENRMLAERFRIMSIPTIMVFKNGEQVDSMAGAASKQQYIAMLEKHW
jgi:thioredoxin